MTESPAGGQAQRHPAVVAELQRRRADVQLRVADKITAFAGSMNFVYLHAVLFVIWMVAFEKSPWPTLTLFVSLEAIFLSTFVMIGQNRQSDFAQAKANRDFNEGETELHQNTEITRLIHQLTVEIHNHYLGPGQSSAEAAPSSNGSAPEDQPAAPPRTTGNKA